MKNVESCHSTDVIRKEAGIGEDAEIREPCALLAGI